MNKVPGWEALLMSTTDGMARTKLDLDQVMARLHEWLCELTQTLSARQLHWQGTVRADHAIAQQAREVNVLLSTCSQAWDRQWAALEPARQLALAFEDRVVLLVHGKFNAGKSSLCNFLADRFAAYGQSVQYFHGVSGQIVETAEPLREGAVESTARLQGVCLGNHLVLLDTPGLHSVTSENAELTRRFMESADAVLWLTSSTSPGQVQELDELTRELGRGKPLLPVITRSDIVEEDEVDGEIVTWLRNKCPAHRLLQEADVRQRGQAKLRHMAVDPGCLQTPVSVSVHMAREQGETVQALVDSGFDHVCAALLHIVGPARAYKQRKPAEVMLHHLEENVLGAIVLQVQPLLSQLGALLAQERTRLQEQQPRLVRAVVRQVLPELTNLLERYTTVQEVVGLCHASDGLVQGALVDQVPHYFGGFEVRLMAPCGDPQVGLPLDLGYEGLYNALTQRVVQSIADQVEDAGGQCIQVMDALEVSVRRLQHVLAQQHDRLMHIKHQLRHDEVPSADVGEDVETT